MAEYFKGLFGAIGIGFAEVTLRQTGDGKYRNFLARYKYDIGVRARAQRKANEYYTIKGSEEAKRRPIETRNIVKDSMPICVISPKDYTVFWEWANENADKTSVKKAVHDNIKTKNGNKALLGGFILSSIESFITSAESFCQKECSLEEQKVPVEYGKLEIRDNQEKVIITDDRYLLMTLLSNTAPDKYSVEKKCNIKKTETMERIFYVVSHSDYEKLKVYGRNPRPIYYAFESGEVVDAIHIENYDIRAINETQFFEAVDKGAIPKLGTQYGVVEIAAQGGKQSKIVFRVINKQYKELIRETVKNGRRFLQDGTMTANPAIDTCVLKDEDYRILLFALQRRLIDNANRSDIEALSGRDFFEALKEAKNEIARKGLLPPYYLTQHEFYTVSDGIVMLNGFVAKNTNRFYTTRTRFFGANCLNFQPCRVFSGTLRGKYDSSYPLGVFIYDSLFPESDETKLQQMQKAWENEPKIEVEENVVARIENQNISYYIPKTRKIILSGKNCHCTSCSRYLKGSTVIDCTAKVSTKKGMVVPITVQCCLVCGRLYLNYSTYKVYNKRYDGLKFQCVIDASEIPTRGQPNLAPQSFLSQCGYSVASGVSVEKRHRALINIMQNEHKDKYEIIEKITELINLNLGNPKQQNAISRWEEDIEFVADYNISTQLDVGEREIEQKGRITRWR